MLLLTEWSKLYDFLALIFYFPSFSSYCHFMLSISLFLLLPCLCFHFRALMSIVQFVCLGSGCSYVFLGISVEFHVPPIEVLMPTVPEKHAALNFIFGPSIILKISIMVPKACRSQQFSLELNIHKLKPLKSIRIPQRDILSCSPSFIPFSIADELWKKEDRRKINKIVLQLLVAEV